MFHVILTPALAIMNRLNYRNKFLLVNIIFLLPLIGLIYSQLMMLSDEQKITERELVGISTAKSGLAIINAVSEYRDIVVSTSLYELSRPNTNFGQRIKEKRMASLALIKKLSSATAALNNAKLNKQLKLLQEAVNNTERNNVSDINVEFDKRNVVVEQSWTILQTLTNISSLSRDREYENFSLMKLVNDDVQLLSMHQGQLRSYGSIVFLQGSINSQVDSTLSRLFDNLEKDKIELTNSISNIKEATRPSDKIAYSEQVFKEIDQAIDILDERILMADELNFSWEEHFQEISQFNSNVFVMLVKILDRVEAKLTTRYQAQNQKYYSLLIGAIIVVFITNLLMMAFNVSTRNAIDSILTFARQMAKGNLTTRVSLTNKDELGQLAQELNQMVDTIRNLIVEVSSSTHAVASHAESVEGTAQHSSSAAEEQLQATALVATAINQMAVSVKNVALNTQNASEQSNLVNDEAKKGLNLVQENLQNVDKLAQNIDDSMQIINRLAEDSDNINNVLYVIKGIAEQTNLLALNAAIEAARAGEQGRGFAVVADEVRNLAQRTHQSTEEIEKMIERLHKGVGDTVSSMSVSHENVKLTVKKSNEVGKAFEKITSTIDEIVAINEEIACASQQQTTVANDIDEKITSISAIGDQATSFAKETSDACQKMAVHAVQLENAIEYFKVSQ